MGYPVFIPPGFDTARCSGCGEMIMWGRSVDPITLQLKIKNGRPVKVPLNIRPHQDGTWFVTGSGRARTISRGELVRGDERRVAHHATCPAAQQFRRRRPAAGAA
jgi:hypothetical protein